MSDDEMERKLSRIEIISPLLPNGINLIAPLANGGQGITYKGLVNGCGAAIKVYYPGQVLKRIEREIEALSKLHHPNIVELLWAGSIVIEDQQIQVVATRLIDGEVLEKQIKARVLSENEIGNLIYDVVSAIESMWSHRIVHRDLKPSNIMIKPDGRACVIDLGVARHITQSTLTEFGYSCGTLGYMSPEQTRAIKQLTCKSDLYALGVVAVECAIGHHPTGRDQMRLLQMGLNYKLPITMAEWEIAPIIMKMLNTSPTERPMPSYIHEALKKYIPA